MELDKIKKQNLSLLVLAAYFALFISSFCILIQQEIGRLETDLNLQMDGAVAGKSYSLMGGIFNIFHSISESHYATLVVLFLSVCATLTGVTAALLIKEILEQMEVFVPIKYLLVLGVTSVYLANIFIPIIYGHIYSVSTALTQPWHNATYFGMRMTANLAMVYFLRIYKNYRQKIDVSDWICFTLFLTLCNAFKSSFFVSFAPVMLILLLKDFIISKGKTFLKAVVFGCGVLISLIPTIFQYFILFGSSDGSGIMLQTERLYRIYIEEIDWLAIPCNLAFPILVTGVIIYKKIPFKNCPGLVISWSMFWLSRFEANIFEETGIRHGHGNFAWGEYYFAMLLFVNALANWIGLHNKKEIEDRCYYIGIAVYLLHFIMGLGYFIYYFISGSYLV